MSNASTPQTFEMATLATLNKYQRLALGTGVLPNPFSVSPTTSQDFVLVCGAGAEAPVQVTRGDQPAWSQNPRQAPQPGPALPRNALMSHTAEGALPCCHPSPASCSPAWLSSQSALCMSCLCIGVCIHVRANVCFICA